MQKGQSLIEITMALGVILLVIGALTITILIGLRNSQFAQNQLQATKLAQAAMENLKLIRDRNIPICVTEGPPPAGNYYWDQNNPAKQPVLWTQSSFDGLVKFFLVSNFNECGLTDNKNLNPGENSLDNKFSRFIFITYEGVDKIKFKVEVSWEDSSGSHKSELVTILTNYD